MVNPVHNFIKFITYFICLVYRVCFSSAMSFKVKEAHWELMVSFMEEHHFLATGRFVAPNARNNAKLLWKELSDQLNALGYGERSPEKWQKVSSDLSKISQ